MIELEELEKLADDTQREPMTHLHLTSGDLLQDQVGRYVTLVRNHDTGDLFGVSIEGHGNPDDVRIENISQLGSYATLAYTPIDTAYQRHGERSRAAVNALPELLAKVKRLEEALEPFAEFEQAIRDSYAGHSDTDVFYRFNETDLPVGAFRRARAALNQETKP